MKGSEGLVFPQTFELRIIFVLKEGATIEEDLLRILEAGHASPSRPRALDSTSAKYGRMACEVTFADREAMLASYAGIGALPYVKAVL